MKSGAELASTTHHTSGHDVRIHQDAVMDREASIDGEFDCGVHADPDHHHVGGNPFAIARLDAAHGATLTDYAHHRSFDQ